jgi:hypothetical protein
MISDVEGRGEIKTDQNSGGIPRYNAVKIDPCSKLIARLLGLVTVKCVEGGEPG